MWLPIAVLVLVILVFLLSWAAFRAVMRRPKTPDLSQEEVLMLSEFFAYAAALRPDIGWFQSRKWQPVSVTAPDGARLCAQWLPCRNPSGSILLFHDYGVSPLTLAPVARWAEKRKLSVLSVTERAHGESGGEYTTLGLLEAQDAVLWAETVRGLAGAGKPIILYGSGMGGMAVQLALTQGLPAETAAAVSEGGYCSVRAFLKHVMKNEYHMRVFPTLQLFCLYGRLAWHVRPAGYDTRVTLKEASIPLLLAHGKEDLRVPSEMSKEAMEACAGPKKLVICEKAGRGACALAEPERYFGELDAFLLPLLKSKTAGNL